MRTGENIYKRKDGRWEARYRKGRNENGIIIYGSCYEKTYTEVKSKLETAKSGITGTAISKCSTPRFDTICNEWLQRNRLRLKPSTYIKYQTNIEKHICAVLGDCLITQITTEKISRFGLYLSSDCGLAPKTIQDILVLLRTILQYGSKQYPGLCGNVDVIYPKKQPQEMRVLSRVEKKSYSLPFR